MGGPYQAQCLIPFSKMEAQELKVSLPDAIVLSQHAVTVEARQYRLGKGAGGG